MVFLTSEKTTVSRSKSDDPQLPEQEAGTSTPQANDLEEQCGKHMNRKNVRRSLFKPLPDLDPGPPPDGGLVAWMQVLGGCCVCAITWGMIASYGVFQTYYKTYIVPEPSVSNISWIGTVQVFFMLFLGAFIGRASDAGYAREAILVGTSMIVFGLFMASLATKYYELFLSQGVCVGVGMGIMYTPQLSVVSSYFKKKKPIAVGFCGTGAGIGGLVFPAMAQQLLPKVGFGTTMRYIAVITAVFAITINLVTRLRIPPRRSGPMFDWRAFTEIPFLTFSIGFFLIYWASYFAFYYVDPYGHTFAGSNSQDSIDLIIVTNALGIPGRLLCGFIASLCLGSLNTAIPVAIFTSISTFCWIAVGNSIGGLWAFACVYGLFGSGIQGLFGMAVASVTDDLSQLGTRMGMVLSVVAFAALTGSPIAGAIINAQDGSYLGAQIWAGVSMLLGAVFLAIARFSSTGLVLRVMK